MNAQPVTGKGGATGRGEGTGEGGATGHGGASALAIAIVAISTFLAWRFGPLLGSLGTDFVDFAALHGGTGQILENPDTRLNAWILSWVQHAALLEPARLFDGNAFYPLPNTIAGSEHLIGVALQTLPFRLFTQNAIALHQLALLLSSALLAATSFAFVRGLGASVAAATLAGIAAIAMPWRITELAHLQLLSAQLVPWVWLGVLRWLAGPAEAPKPPGARWLAAAIAVQLLSSFYLAYFLTFSLAVIAVAAWGMARPAFTRVTRLAAIGAPGYALLALVAIPYLRSAAASDLQSQYEPTYSISPADALAYVAPRLPHSTPEAFNGDPSYFVPIGVALLAAVALGAALWRGGHSLTAPARAGVIALSLLCVASFVMMLGGRLALGGPDSTDLPLPSYWLAQWVPGFANLRGPSRWGLLIGLAAPLLAGLGVAALEGAARSSRARIGIRVVAFLAVLLSVPWLRVPTRPAWSDAQRVDERSALLALQGEGAVLAAPWLGGHPGIELDSLAMIESTRHWRGLLNGYTGHEPARFAFVQRQGRELPERRAIDRLQRLTGVRWIQLDSSRVDAAALARWDAAAERGWLRRVPSDARDRLYEIPPSPANATWRDALTATQLPPRTLRGVARTRLALGRSDGSLRVEPRQRVRAGLIESRFTLHVDNASSRVWPGFDPRSEGLVRARVSYRRGSGAADGERVQTALAALDVDLPPGRTTTRVWLPPPLRPGPHSVCIDLVQSIGGRIVSLGLAPAAWTIDATPGDVLPDMWDSVMAHQAGEPLPACGAREEGAT